MLCVKKIIKIVDNKKKMEGNVAVRGRGRNIFGHRAILNVPCQRGGNITIYLAIMQNGGPPPA